MGGSLSIANHTKLPLVVVLSQVGPLYWSVINPGDTWTQSVGRVWFTVSAQVYDGNNEPTVWSAVIPIVSAVVSAVLALASFGASVQAQVIAGTTTALQAGSTFTISALSVQLVAKAVATASALAGVSKEAISAAVGRALQPTTQAGVYADGKTITIVGGVDPENGDLGSWQPISMEGTRIKEAAPIGWPFSFRVPRTGGPKPSNDDLHVAQVRFTLGDADKVFQNVYDGARGDSGSPPGDDATIEEMIEKALDLLNKRYKTDFALPGDPKNRKEMVGEVRNLVVKGKTISKELWWKSMRVLGTQMAAYRLEDPIPK